MRFQKIRVSILLFLLIASLFWLFISYFSIDLSTDLYKKLIITTFPAYIILYLSILIHLFNYLDRNTFLVDLDPPEQEEYNVSTTITIQNKTDKSLAINRVESKFFKTKVYPNNDFIVSDNSTLAKDITFELRPEYRESSSALTSENCLIFSIYVRSFRDNKPLPIVKKTTNPFFGKNL